MSARPWFKMFPSDFIAGCLELTVEEKGAFATVLFLIYDKGDALPDDPQWIARVCGCSTRRWKQLLEKLVNVGKLTIQSDGRIHSMRAQKEIETSVKEARKFAENGAKGGLKKAENSTVSNDVKHIDEKRLEFHASMLEPDKKKERKSTPLPPFEQPMLFEEAQPAAAEHEDEEPAFKEVRPSAQVLPMQGVAADRVTAMSAWNAMAADAGLAKITTMASARIRSLNARLKEHGIDGVLLAIKSVGESDFCCGKSQRGWKADFDWLLNAVKFERAINGAYANKPNSRSVAISEVTGRPFVQLNTRL